jgi:hypothetical protein
MCLLSLVPNHTKVLRKKYNDCTYLNFDLDDKDLNYLLIVSYIYIKNKSKYIIHFQLAFNNYKNRIKTKKFNQPTMKKN